MLIDQRTYLKPGVSACPSARQDAVGAGSDGILNEVEHKYPWLRGAGSTRIGDSWWDNGDIVFVSDEDAAPVTFVALFQAERQHVPARELMRATAPVAVSDLLVALAPPVKVLSPSRESRTQPERPLYPDAYSKPSRSNAIAKKFG
jgi:hypothetical protein